MSFLSNPKNKLETFLFFSLLLLLPTQLGKHFWPDFSFIKGIPVDYLSPTLYVTDIIICLLFVCWITQIRLQKRTILRVFLNVPVQCFVGIGLYVFVIAVLSDRPIGSLYSVLKFFELSFLAYYVSRTIRSVAQYEQVVATLAIAGIGESMLAIGQFIHQGSLGSLLYFVGERSFTSYTPGIANASINGELLLRPYGTFSHPNVLAGYLLILLILALSALQILKKRWQYYVCTSFLLIGTAALLLTLSRVALILWFGILCTSFLFIVIKKRISQKKTCTTILTRRNIMALLVVLLVVTLSIITPVGQRFLETSIAEEAFVQRLSLISATIEIIKSSPFFGVGPGNYLSQLAIIQQPLSLGLYQQPVHNIFLLVFAETGMVGLGALLVFLVYTVRRQIASVKEVGVPALALLVALFVLFVLGMTDHYWLTLQQGQLLFSLLLGMSWSHCGKEY